MTWLIAGSAGLALAGVPGTALGLGLVAAGALRRRLRRDPLPVRPLLLVLLVELRSGRSVLGALQVLAQLFPAHAEVTRAARVATVAGLTRAVETSDGEIRSVLAQLARAQRSGAPLADVVRSMIEADIAAEKTRRMARSRALPVRLMIPVTLLLLPGTVLLLYAPSLIVLFEEVSGPFS